MRRGIVIAIMVIGLLCIVSIPTTGAEKNNAIEFIDTNAEIIKGYKLNDLRKAKRDIKKIFRKRKFRKFRQLIKANGDQIKFIDNDSLRKSLLNTSLNRDDSALIEIVICAINSQHIHWIEFVEEKFDISEMGQKLIYPGIEETEPVVSLDSNMKVYWHVKGKGGALTVKHESDSYSIILIDTIHENSSLGDYFKPNKSEVIPNPGGRAAITGHELFGHGLPFTLKTNYNDEANADGVRTENLILRVMGYMVQRTGMSHNKERKVVEGFSELPDSCEEMIKQNSPKGMRD